MARPGNSPLLLYGRNAVVERLKANMRGVRKVILSDKFDDPAALDLIKARRIPVQRLSEKEMLKMKRTERLQGIIAEVDPFRYSSFEDLVSNPEGEKLSFILLDEVTDPQNLGAIIRIAACFGGFGIVIPERGACDVNETVLSVAAGGDNYVPICRINNLSNALIHAKGAGYWCAGAVVDGGEDLTKVSFPFPLCVVMGSEGKGIHHGVEKHLELKVTLPMGGAALSFNVAMASAIFCYEIARQRTKASKTTNR
ncbi:MAG: 23S rRNA (guanosine(2251)-2'-O)-methyltransferase RlmB [Candidatus Omnitrophota bacterium]